MKLVFSFVDMTRQYNVVHSSIEFIVSFIRVLYVFYVLDSRQEPNTFYTGNNQR